LQEKYCAVVGEKKEQKREDRLLIVCLRVTCKVRQQYIIRAHGTNKPISAGLIFQKSDFRKKSEK
jgi:hypothetical protein